MNSSGPLWDAEQYDREFSFVPTFGEDLLGLLGPKSNERILDLGCGTGQLTQRISKMAGEVVGLDNPTEMIELARRKFPDLNFVLADASTFDLDSQFDAIFSNAALHWILDYRSCIQRMYENLKTGGRLVLELGGKGNIQCILNPLRTVLKKYGYSRQSALQPWYFPSIAEYCTVLESEGFRVTLAQHFDRPTKLEDDVIGWLDMFAQMFFEEIPAEDQDKIKKEVQQLAEERCYLEGSWFADYKRLRIIAFKQK